jgi:radical SAM protein with 4Fe4S-binding SPASM domain
MQRSPQSAAADKAEPRPLPRSFVLELTRGCNHRCAYCYTAWGAPELRYPRNGRDSTAEEIEQMVGRLQEEAPVQQIALSGGEPLLRKDLARIVAFIAGRGITPIVITNGSLLTPERIDELAPHCGFEVTLLSTRRDVHDALTGNRGSWDAAVEGMTDLCERGLSFVAAFIATRRNYADVYQTGELAVALGARALMYNRMNVGAFNGRDAAALLPTAAMVRENLDALERLAATYGLLVAASVVIEPCVVDVRKYEHISFGWCPLAGADSYFTIDPAGNVRICNHSPTILGNLKRDRFADIYYGHPYVREFAETLPAECAGCDPELLALCRGGCKAAAEQFYGTLRRVDPFVTLNRG